MDDKVNVTQEVEGKDEPLENQKMKIVIELERIYDPNRSKNNLMMTMEACSFSDDSGEVSKLVGEILHGIPSNTVIRDKETGEDWVLSFQQLFEEYKKVRGRLDATLETIALAKIKTAGEEEGEEIRDEHMGLDDGTIFDESGFSSGAGIVQGVKDMLEDD